MISMLYDARSSSIMYQSWCRLCTTTFQPAIIPEEAFAVAHCHGQVNVGRIDMVGAGPQELTRGRVQQAPCSIRPSPSSRAEMAMVSTSCFLFLRGLK